MPSFKWCPICHGAKIITSRTPLGRKVITPCDNCLGVGWVKVTPEKELHQ